VAASNADLEERCQQQRFRIDLLYRLNVLTLHMPALREREEDTVEVARDYVTKLCQQYRYPHRDFHPDALAFLRHYHWPGNVRELENLLHRDFLLSDEPLLSLQTARHKLSGIAVLSGKVQERMLGFKEAKARCIEEFEKSYIRELMDQAEGNLSAAARLAGKERSAFGKLVRKYGLGGGPELGDSGEAPA
jgi:DNA-binding NtrC family response regulator